MLLLCQKVEYILLQVMAAEDPTENDELIEVTIKSSVMGVPDAKSSLAC